MLEMIGEVKTCPHGHPIGDYPASRVSRFRRCR